MNNVSILIYLADVLPSMGKVLAGLSFASLLITTILGFIGITGGCRHETNEKFVKLAKTCAPSAAGLLLVSMFIPSSPATFYAIAASEVGEEIIKSPTAGKVVTALDSWLDEQIAEKGDLDEPKKEENNNVK